MDQLTKDMNAILDYIDKNRWIAFSKDDSPNRFKAKDKLRAYNLIERHGELSWQLTQDGYTALKLGGFHIWIKTKEGARGGRKFKILVSKLWWTFVIPLIVGLILWSLPPFERKEKIKNVLELKEIPLKEKESKTNSSLNEEKSEDINASKNTKVYLHSYEPIELFEGNIIITLNKSIEYINQEIELKLVSKKEAKTEITKGKKIGDLIEFNNYVILLYALERNISTYDLVIKIETKSE